MCTIKVFLIMQGRDYPTAGEALYHTMVAHLNDEDRVVLDMDGVLLLPSMFLNVSIGRLANEKGAEFVKNKISFSHIKASDAQRIKQFVARFE